MGKGIPWGYYQGNRSERIAFGALSKLGFTVPVPRQEDHFGVDFIVHLAHIVGKIVSPLGLSFGIQIKSAKKPVIFDLQEERDSIFNSQLPFFLGVVSRKTMILEVYSTLTRLCFFWMKSPDRPFRLVFKDTGEGLIAPDYDKGKVWTGKPILTVSIKDPPTSKERLAEIRNLQSTMESWIALENEVLSLKQQRVPTVFRPKNYETNRPIKIQACERIAYSNPATLPNICVATEKVLDSLTCYLNHCLKLPPELFPEGLYELIKAQAHDVAGIRERNRKILRKMKP